MRLLKSPNAWSCLPAAFAMAAGCSVEELIDRIHHDGSNVLWPDLPEPKRRRGFHHQECIAAIFSRYLVTQFELQPRHAPDSTVEPLTIVFNPLRFDAIVGSTRGVLTGYTHRCGHAVAYDHGCICDPRGTSYLYSALKCCREERCDLHDFSPLCVFVLTPRPQ
jgi:hypothetical protein